MLNLQQQQSYSLAPVPAPRVFVQATRTKPPSALDRHHVVKHSKAFPPAEQMSVPLESSEQFLRSRGIIIRDHEDAAPSTHEDDMKVERYGSSSSGSQDSYFGMIRDWAAYTNNGNKHPAYTLCHPDMEYCLVHKKLTLVDALEVDEVHKRTQRKNLQGEFECGICSERHPDDLVRYWSSVLQVPGLSPDRGYSLSEAEQVWKQLHDALNNLETKHQRSKNQTTELAELERAAWLLYSRQVWIDCYQREAQRAHTHEEKEEEEEEDDDNFEQDKVIQDYTTSFRTRMETRELPKFWCSIHQKCHDMTSAPKKRDCFICPTDASRYHNAMRSSQQPSTDTRVSQTVLAQIYRTGAAMAQASNAFRVRTGYRTADSSSNSEP